MREFSIRFDALEPRRKKVAIVGFASSTRLKAPYGDQGWEVWAMNQLYRFIPRATRWFEIHPHIGPRSWLTDQVPGTDYLKWMAEAPIPVYMVSRHPAIPNSVEYPLTQMIEEFGLDTVRPDMQGKGYFHSSVDYMIALAISEGFEEIGIWGVDMVHDCVDPSTRVLTADLRWVRADKLSVGDEIVGFDEGAGSPGSPTPFRRWRKAVVTATQQLTRPSYRVVMADGTEFIASKGHQWLTHAENANRWKRTDELVTPHHRRGRPTRIVRLTDVWNEDRSWDAGYLASAFDGEGHLSQSPRCYGGAHVSLGYSQRDNEMAAQVLASMAALRFKFRPKRHADSGLGTCFKYTLRGDRAEVMRLLGQVRPRRLMAKFNPDAIGILRSRENVAVERLEFLGEQPVIGLGTSTKTFVAEGFASHNSEYGYQKPSGSFWLGVARGRGITLTIPEASALLANEGYRYGYDAQPDNPVMAQLLVRAKGLGERRDALIAEKIALDGALQENAFWQEFAKQLGRGARPTLTEE